MTFRARLTLFFLGIIAAPLLVGALVADYVSRTQALRDADARLQVASVAAADALQRERLSVGEALSSADAVRAFRAGSRSELGRLRTASRLDYLLVIRGGRVAAASVDLPPAIRRPLTRIAQGELRYVAAERRVIIPSPPRSSVLGGRLWEPHLPPSLEVRSVPVVLARPAQPVPGGFRASSQPFSAGGMREVCLCRGGRSATGLALFTPVDSDGVWSWFTLPRVVLVLLAIATVLALAYVLAWLLSRPLSRLAEEVAAVARGERHAPPAVDPMAGREIYEVAQSVRTVSEELSGSRDELERTRGELVASERMTLTDPLTEVWNRRYLDGALREQTKRHARFDSQFALLLIDIDGFKRVNDAHGHVVGDAILRGVAHAIRGSIRSDIDVLARFGGDEFAAVLPESDGQGAPAAAEKIRKLVAESPFESDGTTVSITVSIGVAVCPRDGLDSERILAAADAALYRAKAEGRNRTSSASEPDET